MTKRLAQIAVLVLIMMSCWLLPSSTTPGIQHGQRVSKQSKVIQSLQYANIAITDVCIEITPLLPIYEKGLGYQHQRDERALSPYPIEAYEAFTKPILLDWARGPPNSERANRRHSYKVIVNRIKTATPELTTLLACSEVA